VIKVNIISEKVVLYEGNIEALTVPDLSIKNY
jgi:hypothetical protein